jgi:hypothetical protein
MMNLSFSFGYVGDKKGSSPHDTPKREKENSERHRLGHEKKNICDKELSIAGRQLRDSDENSDDTPQKTLIIIQDGKALPWHECRHSNAHQFYLLDASRILDDQKQVSVCTLHASPVPNS